MAFSGYSGSLQISVSDNASLAGPTSSLNFSATSNNNTIVSKTTYVLGGNAVGSINEVASNILTITASGSATLDLQTLTDVLGQSAIVLVRLKRYVFWLLSTLDDTINGTNASSVSVGGGASNPNILNLAGTTPTFTLNNTTTGTGDKIAYANDTAAGITVSASALNVKVANNDAVNAAAVYYNLAGSTT